MCSIAGCWGNYFRIGNAAKQFRQIDWYVTMHLFRLMVGKRVAVCVPDKLISGLKSGLTGTACTGFEAPSATRRLRNNAKKIIGKPCAGRGSRRCCDPADESPAVSRPERDENTK
jgi:hypothetical protein